MQLFTKVENQYSYTEFLDLAQQLLEQGKTTGEDQSELKLHFHKLNLQRMLRWDKTIQLPDDITSWEWKPQRWFVITEGWCGDSAQNLPTIAAVAKALSIELSIVLRDENPDVIDAYLTNGGRSIPVLVAFDEEGKFLYRWGPRPETAQTLFLDWKTNPQGRSFDDFELELHTWYTKNKGQELLAELKALNA